MERLGLEFADAPLRRVQSFATLIHPLLGPGAVCVTGFGIMLDGLFAVVEAPSNAVRRRHFVPTTIITVLIIPTDSVVVVTVSTVVCGVQAPVIVRAIIQNVVANAVMKVPYRHAADWAADSRSFMACQISAVCKAVAHALEWGDIYQLLVIVPVPVVDVIASEPRITTSQYPYAEE